MKGVKIIAIAVIAIIIAGIGFYGYNYETTGTMKIGTEDTSSVFSPAIANATGASSSSQILDLNVTISTIGLYNSTTGWHNYTIDKTVTVFSTTPSNSSLFDNLSVHAGSYSKILVNITGVNIYYNNSIGTISVSINLTHPVAVMLHTITIHAHGSTTLFINFNGSAFGYAALQHSKVNIKNNVNINVKSK